MIYLLTILKTLIENKNEGFTAVITVLCDECYRQRNFRKNIIEVYMKRNLSENSENLREKNPRKEVNKNRVYFCELSMDLLKTTYLGHR